MNKNHINIYISLIKESLDINISDGKKHLSNYCYIPNLLKDLVSTFIVEDFLSTTSFENAFKYEGNKDIKVFFAEYENEKLPSLETFINSIEIPLPFWAKEFQYYLLSQVYNDIKCGWSLDFFVSSGKNISLGSHIDNDDVYTVQLYGTKYWILDAPDLYRVKGLMDNQLIKQIPSSETWVSNTNQPLDFIDPTIIIMKPGDFLAIPAYALHKVTTLTEKCNLSFNVGIRQEDYWQKFLYDLQTKRTNE